MRPFYDSLHLFKLIDVGIPVNNSSEIPRDATSDPILTNSYVTMRVTFEIPGQTSAS